MKALDEQDQILLWRRVWREKMIDNGMRDVGELYEIHEIFIIIIIASPYAASVA